MDSTLIDGLLRVAVECEASDLILHTGKRGIVRAFGELTEVESEPITQADMDEFWTRCGGGATELDHDGSLCLPDGTRFRINLLHHLGARGAVLRRIRSEIPALETLGAPTELLQEWASHKAGIVIVAGPTGSGKSTTLAATLNWMNGAFKRHVVTIEDPVEYVFTPLQSVFTQREVGVDTPTFAEGLRRSMRQNPDVILLGEIRDVLSASTALQAAETGHLVLATLHAATCADVVDRLQLLFPPDERESIRKTLASQLLGVMCQRLVPAVSGAQVLLCEYFTNGGFSRKIITEGKMPELQDFIARGDPKTARAFTDSLVRLVRESLVDEKVALEISDNPQELSRMLKGISSASQARR